MGGTAVTYPARQLHSIYLSSGRLFRQELLPIDRYAEARLDRLLPHVRHHQQLESVMADVYVTGTASLLGVTLDAVKHFFIQREQRPYLEMTERKYLALQNGTQYVADANDYRNQLLGYFGDCEATAEIIKTAPFTAVGLTQVVQAYNVQCSASHQSGREISLSKPHQARVTVRVGLLGGIRYNTVRNQNKIDIDGLVHAQGGIYLDFVHLNQKLALHSAVLVSNYGRPDKRATDYIWRGVLANIQLGVRGFLPLSPRSQLVAGVGYELNYFLEKYNKGYPQRYLYADNFSGSLLPYLEAGVRLNRIMLLAHGRAYTPPKYFTPRPYSLSLSVGYQLFKDSESVPAR